MENVCCWKPTMEKEKPTYFVNVDALGELHLNFHEKWCNKKIFAVERFSVGKLNFVRCPLKLTLINYKIFNLDETFPIIRIILSMVTGEIRMKTIEIQASIEEKREELIELIRKYGFNHHRVITCSQELDILLYRLMEIVACTE